jgi:ABC-type phosphate transport system permease subunit
MPWSSSAHWPTPNCQKKLREAAEAAGLTVLRLIQKAELPAGRSAALTAAILAEDLAPPPD